MLVDMRQSGDGMCDEMIAGHKKGDTSLRDKADRAWVVDGQDVAGIHSLHKGPVSPARRRAERVGAVVAGPSTAAGDATPSGGDEKSSSGLLVETVAGPDYALSHPAGPMVDLPDELVPVQALEILLSCVAEGNVDEVLVHRSAGDAVLDELEMVLVQVHLHHLAVRLV